MSLPFLKSTILKSLLMNNGHKMQCQEQRKMMNRRIWINDCEFNFKLTCSLIHILCSKVQRLLHDVHNDTLPLYS